MTGPDDERGGGRPLELSRRQLLAGVAAVGVGATTGAGTAARFTDAESRRLVSTAGTVDIDAEWRPATANPDTLRSPGQTARGTTVVSVPIRTDETPTNPAHLWMRTNCAPDCDDADGLWSRLDLTVVDRGSGQEWTGSLCAVLSELADGVYLGTIDPGETRAVDIEWRLTSALESATSVPFSMELYAAQERGNDAPLDGDGWPAAASVVDCGRSDDARANPDISFVAFCGSELSPDAVSLTTRHTGDRVTGVEWTAEDADAMVESVVLKYDTRFEVFDDPGTVVTVGEGEVVPVSESARSPAEPCLNGTCTLKYEVDGGDWELRGCSAGDGGDDA